MVANTGKGTGSIVGSLSVNETQKLGPNLPLTIFSGSGLYGSPTYPLVVDAISAGSTTGRAGHSLYTGATSPQVPVNQITVGAGATNLIVGLIYESTAVGTVTVTWDQGGTNQVMTRLGTPAGLHSGAATNSLYGL